MSDLFKSALGYFSSTSAPGEEHELVGQTVEVGNVKLRVKKLIAEGGFGFVFVAQDPSSGNEYALKRLVAGDDAADRAIRSEINLLRSCRHANIVRLLSVAHAGPDYLMLMELCAGGSLAEMLAQRKRPLEPAQAATAFWQAASAVAYLHALSPPVMHRDIKMENLLLRDGVIKLCDFGSATTQEFRPDTSWSAAQRTLMEEDLARATTPMYRSPEMVDVWCDWPVTTQVDVWALGVMLHALTLNRMPFEDGAKLAVINAHLTLPQGETPYTWLHDIMRGCLVADPRIRLTASQAAQRTEQMATQRGFDVRLPIVHENTLAAPSAAPTPGKPPTEESPRRPPPRPRPPTDLPPPGINHGGNMQGNPVHPTSQAPAQRPVQMPAQMPAQGGLFSSIRGGAGSFLKNLKDTSSKVMQTVQQSIARNDLDMSYMTSRVLVMPFPAEGLESAYRCNHADDVRAFLEARFPGGGCCVYNVSGRAYGGSRLGQRHVEAGWSQVAHRVSPGLQALLELAIDMYRHLDKDSSNVVVIHCMEGKADSALAVSALFIYAGLFHRAEDAAQMFAVKRYPPSMQPSQMRYLYYLGSVLKGQAEPHTHPLTIVSITLSPVPMFTKARDGCRPYVEVHQGETRVLSTCREIERMRLFGIGEGRVTLPLNATVCGDVTISVYHGRNSLGNAMMAGRPTGVKIAQLQFHSGFVDPEETTLRFARSELDDPAEPDRYPERFTVILSVLVSDEERRLPPPPWHSLPPRSTQPLFSSNIERDETLETFVCRPEVSATPPSRPAPLRPPPPVPAPPRKEYRDSSDSDPESKLSSAAPINPARREINLQPEADLLDIGSSMAADVDLLGVGNGMPASAATPIASPRPASNVDLLGGFATFDNKRIHSDGNLFDPFGGDQPQTGAALLAPVAPSMPRNASTPNLDARPRDPFADIGVLGSSLGVSSPAAPWAGSKPTSPLNGTPAPSPQGTPMKRSPGAQPDYSRQHFTDKVQPGLTPQDPAPGKGDIFGDLLGSQGYEFAAGKRDAGPRTINQMRKVELAKDMDPETLKVAEWTEGRKANIRALLCSLHTVLWDGAKWSRCDMSQLVSALEVKKSYRRACLAVHPDKQAGTEHESLAKMLFMALNAAWAEFENDATQQMAFAAH